MHSPPSPPRTLALAVLLTHQGPRDDLFDFDMRARHRSRGRLVETFETLPRSPDDGQDFFLLGCPVDDTPYHIDKPSVTRSIQVLRAGDIEHAQRQSDRRHPPRLTFHDTPYKAQLDQKRMYRLDDYRYREGEPVVSHTTTRTRCDSRLRSCLSRMGDERLPHTCV